MDALILSRLQFAITTIYHFLFVPVTLGLSIFVALLETWYINSGSYEERIKLKKLVKFFVASKVSAEGKKFRRCLFAARRRLNEQSYPKINR